MTQLPAGLPPAVTVGGYIYVLGFSDRTIKVGKTRNPAARLTQHLETAGGHGIALDEHWVSPCHHEYSQSERSALEIARSMVGPDFYQRRYEYFAGIDFAVLVGRCIDLPMAAIEPEAHPWADGNRAAKPQEGIGHRILRAANDLVPNYSPDETVATGARGPAFAALISGARKAKGISQDSLARLAGINRSTVIRWESGGMVNPVPDQVRRVCLFLEVHPIAAALALGYVTADEVYEYAEGGVHA